MTQYFINKTNEFYFQNEMTFERFSCLQYQNKLPRCNRAFTELVKRQTKVNRLLNVLRDQPRMQQIFDQLLQINSILHQTIANLFDEQIIVEHQYHIMKSNLLHLRELSNDLCQLLDYLSRVPKTDSDMDVLYITAYSIKDSQIKFWQEYYIEYDWGAIFSSKSPIVCVQSENFNCKFLTTTQQMGFPQGNEDISDKRQRSHQDLYSCAYLLENVIESLDMPESLQYRKKILDYMYLVQEVVAKYVEVYFDFKLNWISIDVKSHSEISQKIISMCKLTIAMCKFIKIHVNVILKNDSKALDIIHTIFGCKANWKIQEYLVTIEYWVKHLSHEQKKKYYLN